MAGGSSALRILHVLRAPVGGLFRHVQDLARGQQAQGHAVAIVADATPAGEMAETKLEALARDVSLGLFRVPMPRQAGPGDFRALKEVSRIVGQIGPDIVHGHGAKGGAYARMASAPHAIRAYTPHGGSLHYTRRSPVGLVYLEVERALARRTDVFLFESAYAHDLFEKRVAATGGRGRVVHNGVPEGEFAPCPAEDDAADFSFVGELRQLKGVGELLQALAVLHHRGRPATAAIAGDGPDRAWFEREAQKLGLSEHVAFLGARPAREVFPRGRCLVVPSRAESLPYIVLEAGAAEVPMIATSVGGIPEIFGPLSESLVPPRAHLALADAMAGFLDRPQDVAERARVLKARIRDGFSLERMTHDILAAYAEANARRWQPSG